MKVGIAVGEAVIKHIDISAHYSYVHDIFLIYACTLTKKEVVIVENKPDQE